MSGPFVDVLHGDARTLASRLASHGEAKDARFSLVYVDPPYNVGKVHTARGEKGYRHKGEAAYRDSFRSTDDLVALLAASLGPLIPLLADDGSLVVHMDARAVHEAKVGLDRLIGPGAYRGEIVWVVGNGAKGKGVPVTHQTLLVYAKGPEAPTVWNDDDPDLREPYADLSLEMHFRNVDADGRRYRERTVGKKTYRYYADQGRKRGSVWTDIPGMIANTPLQKESTGYPTQKPVRLLDRLVRATTRPGDWVLDPMCGSGTTVVAAKALGRSAIGNDEGELAVSIARGRLGLAAPTDR